MVTLCLTFQGVTILLSTMAELFYSLTSTVQELQFLHTLSNAYYYYVFYYSCSRVKWYLVILTCISLMTNGVEHLLVCLLAICISTLEKLSIHFRSVKLMAFGTRENWVQIGSTI